MPFTDVFGGSTLQAAQVAYRAVALSADVTLVWPPYSTSATDYVARIMDVTPSAASLAIKMPDATLVGPGQDVFYRNLGSDSFTVNDSAGNAIAAIAAGAVRYFYLQDNSTAAGTWASILLGVGSSNLDASQLAGYGLKVTGSTLSFAPVVSTFNANTTITAAARGSVYVWTGGTGILTLPPLADASSMPDWEIEVSNQGTGTLTIAPVGGELIDAAASIALSVTESGFVHTGPAAWYTVGRGRNTQFNFTTLAKSVTGGSTTLSLTEAANVIQIYSGALGSNEVVTLPAVVQVYYLRNSTTGAHTLTFKSPVTGGSTVAVDQNASAIVFCDGANIISCNTSGVTVSSVSLAAGSVSSPSLKFAADTTSGIYQPASGQLAITLSGVQKFLLTSTGINNTAIGATTASTGAFTTLAVAGNTITPAGNFATAGVSALTLTTTGATNVTLPTAGTLATRAGVEALTNKSINGLTVTASTGTLTIANAKTFAVSNSVTLVGTDGTTITLPGTSSTLVAQGAITTSGLTQATARLLGRTTAATGAVEEISIGSGLSMTAGSLSATASAAIFGIVSGSNFATGSNTLVDITGLTAALAANSTYILTAQLSCSGNNGNGFKVGVNYSAAGATLEAGVVGQGASSSSSSNTRLSAFATASNTLAASNGAADSTVSIVGTVVTGANAGNLTIQVLRTATNVNVTVYTGSMINVVKVA